LVTVKIRPLKTTTVTIEDTKMENCLGKAKYTSAEGCADAQAQQAQGADNRSSFLFLMQWCPVPFTQIV
jgi:hypothetical protein